MYTKDIHKKIYLFRALLLSIILLCISVIVSSNAFSQNQTYVHDPVMIRQDSIYYLFCTGWGVSVWSSPDMINWNKNKPVFSKAPAWALSLIPGFKGHIWAPDISFHNGKYYLYYSVSAFGKNTSSIGVATNTTLHPDDPAYRWEDQGMVIQSVPGRDLWNAIDPNLAFDENRTPWLVFGSFWSGMKLVKMNADLRSPAEPQEWYTVAKRERHYKTEDADPGEGAVEAPFIFKKGKYYYLFLSFDFCCRGIKSNYKIMAGRSEKITGPYIDKEGNRLDQGGGTLVLKGDESWPGVGHNSAYTFDDKDFLIFHGYDASDNGKSKLLIREIHWDNDGWPMVSL
ncbi:MAG TPA: arabinan endo-1,5-alpha-L-arabinosidase [Caldithrix sp.]|nr:arabinan endo-1,5-alpha-L-arabinosidase [Bacteroidales bacterium]HEM48763.1 arabinan endo-1,5-alpha-L-arabinosidase [Caldithrix sp.]